MVKISYEAYNDPFIVNFHKDVNTGKPITIEITNEQQKIIDCRITLNEIPDEFRKVTIQGMEEVERIITSPTQYKVDYTYGIVQFHPSVEDGRIINILRYYGRGVALIPSSRVYLAGKDIVETLDQYLSSITSYDYKGEYSSNVNYGLNNIVYFNGSTYINTAPCQNVTPYNNNYWREMSSGFLFVGDYNSTATYYKNQIVTKDKTDLYLCLKQNTGVSLTVVDTWVKIMSIDGFKQLVDSMIEQGNQKIIELTNASNEYTNILKPDIIDKTTKANEATVNANQATQNTNNAISNCVTETNKCTTATNTCITKTGECTTATTQTISAKDTCVSETNKAKTATTNAINATNTCTTETGKCITATNNANSATSSCTTVTNECTTALENYEQNLLLSIKIFKDPVQNFSDIATTYPNPQNGWTVKVLSDSKIYRFDGVILNNWQFIDSSNVDQEIAVVDAKIGALANLNTTDKTNTVSAINEVNTKITNEISKIHTHTNKSVLDLLADVGGNLQYNGKLIVTDIDGGTF